MNAGTKSILVIGGGVAGMTAALEAAEVGYPVVLVEREASLGGRVVRMHRYFPKMCPPTCGFEINIGRIRRNPNIIVPTLATVDKISGGPGAFRVRLRVKPRYVTGAFSLDDAVAEPLTSERDDDFNYGMCRTKALYMPHDMAYPPFHVIDREALSETDAEKLRETCPAGAIDLEMREKEINLHAGAIIVATGWRPYDAARLDTLGFERYPDVITNVMMERLAARRGPTGGEILRPSDGKKAENIAFVQCAGSRDENHLPYCSAVCCMGSLKQARYVREKDENSRVTIFYIDIRTIGSLENFYYEMLDDENVTFVKGKVAAINGDSDGKKLTLDVEDTVSRERLHPGFDLVVLATGVVPSFVDAGIPVELKQDEYGFIDGTTNRNGFFAAGCATRPCDVSRATKEATAAALRAIQCIKGEE